MADTLYSVVGSNGHRRQNLTLDEAASHVASLRLYAKIYGYESTFRVFYRDGTEVDNEGRTVKQGGA